MEDQEISEHESTIYIYVSDHGGKQVKEKILKSKTTKAFMVQ